MELFKLKPVLKDYLWGGRKLVDDFGMSFDGENCAEAWLLSDHKDGKSLIAGGRFDGKSLSELIEVKGKNILGENYEKYNDFPILIKLIDAKKSLSIQVHPDEEYANKYEGQHGKTEMWYILEANEGSFLYEGFSYNITKAEFKQRIENNTLEEVLNKRYVKKGDVIFITPGTLHAIGKGILLAEIQQSSNVTYRVYDYGRLGADGKTRPLHISQALDVTRLSKPDSLRNCGKYLIDCQYFNVECVKLSCSNSYEGYADEKSFVSIVVVDGEISISDGDYYWELAKGESAFIPAACGKFKLSGTAEILITRIN